MTASKMNPANAKNTKGVAKKAIAKAPVEAAAEAKLSVEDSASTGPLGSAFHAQVVSDSDGGQSGGGMGSTALILGGIALAGGVAVAAAGGGKDSVPVPTPTPPQPLPSYSVAASAASVDEDKSVTFTITDANKVSGQKVTWSVNPDRAADIDGPTSGEVTIDQNGKATVTIKVKADATTEGAETLTFTVGSQNASATINDTSTTPAKTMALTVNADTGADFVGTGLGDTYNATAATFTALDSLDGAGGTDTLNILDQAGAMAGAAPTTATLKSIENIVATSVGSIGTNLTGGSPAVAQKNTVTFTGTVDVAKAYEVNYNGVTQVTALPAAATAAGAATVVAATINALAGATIATVVGGTVEVLAPVAGTPLPQFSVTATSGQAPALVALTTPNAVAILPSAVDTAYDISGFTDVVSFTGSSVGGDNIKAAATQNVTVTNTGGGAVTIAGGLAQTVTQASGAVTLTGAAGAIKVTETAQAASAISVTGGTTVDVTSLGASTGNITVIGGAATTGITVNAKHTGAGNVVVNGGTTVNVTETTSSTGTISVGASPAASGNVTVVQNLNGTGALAGGAIGVKGGESLSVTVNATQATAGQTTVIGAITATGTATTTNATVSQTAAAAVVPAATGVARVDAVTFGLLKAGQSVTVAGKTFLASADASAADVAAAFSTGASTKGAFSGTLTGFTAGTIAAGATVVNFTATAAGVGALPVITHSGGVLAANLAAAANLTVGVDAVAGVTGITNSAVAITDAVSLASNTATAASSLTTATVNNYTTLNIDSNALATLNLKGGSGNITIDNASSRTTKTTTLALTLDGVTGGTLDDANVYTTLNITTANKASTLTDITDTALTALNVAGTQSLTLTSTAGMTVLETVKVSDSAGLKATFDVPNLKSIDASGTSGNNTITFDGNVATYAGGSGVDTVTTKTGVATISKAISLGGGNDVLHLADGVQTLTAVIDGGSGTNTLRMLTANAVVNAASTAFSANVKNFQALVLEGTTGTQVVNIGALAATSGSPSINSNVTVKANTGGAVTLTLDGFASSGTLTLDVAIPVAANKVTLTNTGWAAGASDAVTINLAATVGQDHVVAAAGLESVTVNAAGTVSHKLELEMATLKTVTVAGTGSLTLETNVIDTALTTIDASAMTGNFAVTSLSSTAAATVTGGSGNDVLAAHGWSGGNLTGAALTYAASTVADILIGGAGNDTLYANAGTNTLTGGAGFDTFVVAQNTANSTTFSTITDFAKGDVLALADKGTEVFTAAKLVLADTNATLADYLNAAAAGDGSTHGKISWFQYQGNTYVVEDMTAAATYTAASDIVVKLAGLLDLSSSSLVSATTNQLVFG